MAVSERIFGLLYALSVITQTMTLNTCTLFRPAAIGYNARLVHDSMVTIRTHSLDRCLDWCLHRTGCKSVNFGKTRRMCELMEVTRTSRGVELHTTAPGYVHTDLTDWLKIRVDNPCSNRPCSQDEWCSVENHAVRCLKTGPGCQETFLVSGPHGVPDAQMTASSVHENRTSVQAYQARLDSSNKWDPAVDKGSYIQVEFNKTETLRGVVTKGSGNGLNWVTTYTISSSIHCVSFDLVKDSEGNTKVFDGNTDGSSAVFNFFDKDIVARCLRLNPITSNQYVSLRFDVVGCFYV